MCGGNGRNSSLLKGHKIPFTLKVTFVNRFKIHFAQ